MTESESTRQPARRGTLRIYLGAAAGVGKTFAMLGEGHRRRSRGADVVVAYVETHGRRRTTEQLGGLEVIPRAKVSYRDTTFEEMDVDAVLARHPQIALSTNSPTPTCPARVTPSAGRTSRSCSGPAST